MPDWNTQAATRAAQLEDADSQHMVRHYIEVMSSALKNRLVVVDATLLAAALGEMVGSVMEHLPKDDREEFARVVWQHARR